MASGSANVDAAVRVAVRIRPRLPLDNPLPSEICPFAFSSASQTVTLPDQSSYSFDDVFWGLQDTADADGNAAVSQFDVYRRLVQPLLEASMQGYNCCLFAYGQTGSGKTHTMMGNVERGEIDGMVPLLCKELLTRIDVAGSTQQQVDAGDDDGRTRSVNVTMAGGEIWTVVVGMVEVYNERVFDLLAERDVKTKELKLLNLSFVPSRGAVIEEQSLIPVSNIVDLLALVQRGFRSRATSQTGMNERSSRSHAIIQLHLRKHGYYDGSGGNAAAAQGGPGTHPPGAAGVSLVKRPAAAERIVTQQCVANLVDLAGSEKMATSAGSHTSEKQLTEMSKINLSLTVLGRVIDALIEQSEKKKGMATAPRHIPYRESKLTMLLSSSLGGNSRTAMIGTISPAAASFETSKNTLQFASRARAIINKASVNEDPRVADRRRMLELEKTVSDLLRRLQQTETLEAQVRHLEQDRSRLAGTIEELRTRATDATNRSDASLLPIDESSHQQPRRPVGGGDDMMIGSEQPSASITCRVDNDATDSFASLGVNAIDDERGESPTPPLLSARGGPNRRRRRAPTYVSASAASSGVIDSTSQSPRTCLSRANSSARATSGDRAAEADSLMSRRIAALEDVRMDAEVLVVETTVSRVAFQQRQSAVSDFDVQHQALQLAIDQAAQAVEDDMALNVPQRQRIMEFIQPIQVKADDLADHFDITIMLRLAVAHLAYEESATRNMLITSAYEGAITLWQRFTSMCHTLWIDVSAAERNAFDEGLQARDQLLADAAARAESMDAECKYLQEVLVVSAKGHGAVEVDADGSLFFVPNATATSRLGVSGGADAEDDDGSGGGVLNQNSSFITAPPSLQTQVSTAQITVLHDHVRELRAALFQLATTSQLLHGHDLLLHQPIPYVGQHASSSLRDDDSPVPHFAFDGSRDESSWSKGSHASLAALRHRVRAALFPSYRVAKSVISTVDAWPSPPLSTQIFPPTVGGTPSSETTPPPWTAAATNVPSLRSSLGARAPPK